jgi:uncharacterized protein
MDMETLIAAAEAYARRLLAEAPGSHGWDHTERVVALARRLGEREGAQLSVLKLAALLHDIARPEESAAKGAVDHAQLGAQVAKKFLAGQGAPADLVRAVCHCIESHRFRGGAEPESLEARCLFDADKLDSLGAVGIGRAFLFAGEVGARLHNDELELAGTDAYSREDTAYREFAVKLMKVKERLLTNEGRRLAAGRHRFMSAFFRRLGREVRGRE